MKKLFKIITPLLTLLVILTGCSIEKSKVYVSETATQKNETTIYYKGETVNKVITVSSLSDTGSDINSAMESLKKSIDKSAEGIDGYSYKVEEKDGKINITWELDFNKLNYEKYKAKLRIDNSSLEDERKLSNIEKRLTDNGGKEKK